MTYAYEIWTSDDSRLVVSDGEFDTADAGIAAAMSAVYLCPDGHILVIDEETDEVIYEAA